ncbi:MAG: helix-turn-helix transcriptional regulator [Lachnospiraceae bacterium]|nr:helix-turn-helix transcriptional regulator [Lachnospiraceae bacterium]
MGKEHNLENRKRQAARIRQIRENNKLTQEEFAEILDISVSAYKKVESGENQISLPCLKRLHDEMQVSSDFVLYDRKHEAEEIWADILNCSEGDKLFLFARLMTYFAGAKAAVYPQKDEQARYDKEILQVFKNMRLTEPDKTN